MINRIVDAALGNRTVVLIVIAALVAVGLLSMQRLPFDADPDISPLQVLVTTQASGLAPLDVERSITTPIELALQGRPGMPSYRSISRYGLSVIYVKFADGGDILTDRTLVAQRLSRASLPAEAGTPMLGPLSDGLSEIYQFKVRAKTTLSCSCARSWIGRSHRSSSKSRASPRSMSTAANSRPMRSESPRAR